MRKTLFLGVIFGLIGCSVSMQNMPIEQYSPLVDRAKEHIKYNANDASSMQFREVVVRKQKDADTTVVCGQVNGKNTYGGYTGFKPFYYYESKGNKDSHIVYNHSTDVESSSKNYTYTLWCL